jgi:hypothetical protein
MVTGVSIRKRVLEGWIKNPYLTPKKLCYDLQLDYKVHGRYVKKLLSEFRGYYTFGSPQKGHVFPEHRVFEWENIPRSLLPVVASEVSLRSLGWVPVANRNNMWVFRDPRGTVLWYKEGLVRLYLRGELQLAKAKELFCKAFGWFDGNDLRKYLDVPLKEAYKKWTFDLGSPVPRFDIRQFERSHGLRIFTDGSHPTSIHVGESLPFWIDEQREATKEFGQVVQQFGIEIKEHLKLIRLWQEQATTMRLKSLKRKLKKAEPPSQKSLLEWMLGG